MDTILYGTRAGIELLLWPFDAMGEFVGLTVLSIITGIVMLLVVGKTTPQKRIERARDRMASAIYEVRLYIDSPVRILKAQGRLLWSSFAYVGYMMPAFLLLTVPLGLLFLHLDVRYGQLPVSVGQPVVATILLDEGTDARSISLEPTDGIEMTAPPVYVEDEGAVYVRLTVAKAENRVVTFAVGDAKVEKRIDAGPGIVAPERSSGWGLFSSYGAESPMPSDSGLASISIRHENRQDTWFGMPWWAYWLLLATIAAFAMRRPLDVTI